MADDNVQNPSPSSDNSIPSEYSSVLASIRQKSAQPQQAQASNQGIPQEYSSVLNRLRSTNKTGNDIDTLSKQVQSAENDVNEDPFSDLKTKALQNAYENYYKNTTVGQRASYNLTPDKDTLGNVVQGATHLIGSAGATIKQAGQGLLDQPLETLQGAARGVGTGLVKLGALPIQLYSGAKQQVLAQAGEPSDIPEAARIAAERAQDTAIMNKSAERFKQYGLGDTKIGQGGEAAANITENVLPFVAAPEGIISKGGAELTAAEETQAAQKALNAANKPSGVGANIGKYAGYVLGPKGSMVGQKIGGIADQMLGSEIPTIRFKTPAEVQDALAAEKIGVEAYSSDVERLTKELAADPENNDLKKQLYEATLQKNNSVARLNEANVANNVIQKSVQSTNGSLLGKFGTAAKNAAKTGGLFAGAAEMQQAPGTSVGQAFGQGAALGGTSSLVGQRINQVKNAFNEGIAEEPPPPPPPSATPSEATVGTPEEKAGTPAPETSTLAPVEPTPATRPQQRAGTGPIVSFGRARARLSNPVEEGTLGASHESEKMVSDVLLTNDSPVKNSIEVNSGKIDRVGYDANSKLMYVKLKQPTADGFSQYIYHDVTPVEHAEFINSKSAGKYFENNVKYKYETSAIDPYHTYDQLLKDADRRGSSGGSPSVPTPTTPAPTTPSAPASTVPVAPAMAPAPSASIPDNPVTLKKARSGVEQNPKYGTAADIKQQFEAEQQQAAETNLKKQAQDKIEQTQIEAARNTPEYKQMTNWLEAADKLAKRQVSSQSTLGGVERNPTAEQISNATQAGGSIALNKIPADQLDQALAEIQSPKTEKPTYPAFSGKQPVEGIPAKEVPIVSEKLTPKQESIKQAFLDHFAEIEQNRANNALTAKLKEDLANKAKQANKPLANAPEPKSGRKKVSLAASQPHEGPEDKPLGTSSP